ncbi:DUF4270 domain-containing protein [Flavobacterium sp. LB3P122]|uniref:DUF4270 domain-containing protein n=1 Tax=Flavobacterium algoriphilum TaxID=3398738 RepID=UPI003A869A08
MYNNSFFKKMLVLASIILLYSCDKDYNVIGGDLIGDNHFDLSKYTSSVVAYNQKIGPIQSNDLPVNPLGIYNNPNFGETTANFNTQLILSSILTAVSTRPHVVSVVLTIPYYYNTSKTVTNTDGSHVYTLDSIYGADKAPMKLSVHESGYYMRDTDPVGGFQQTQKYFTNQNADFDNVKVGSRLNTDSNLAQNDNFFFDSAEHVVTSTDSITKVVTTARTPPGMQLNLNKSYFKTRIIDAVAAGKLATNDVFKEYFRGLYFKMEKSGSSAGNLAMLNFKAGKITINYNEDLSTTVSGVTTVTRVKKSIVLNMTGNSVSLLNNNFGSSGLAYNALPNTGSTSAGDEKLYLKGGEGSLAVLNLFSTAGELENIKSKGWLVNEANLVFHIDASAMANSYEPKRVYLYDLTNNRPVVDYYNDATTSINAKQSKLVFDGNINTDVTSKRGLTYKIRITNQIRNLIRNADSTNVKLGIVVTEDITTIASYKMKTPNAFISQAPKASVMNPLGTILYGGKATVPEDKRLKLEIFYTKPN